MSSPLAGRNVSLHVKLVPHHEVLSDFTQLNTHVKKLEVVPVL